MSTHNTFLCRTDENYPSVIIKYPPYLFHYIMRYKFTDGETEAYVVYMYMYVFT